MISYNFDTAHFLTIHRQLGIISSFSATSAPVCSLPNAGRGSAGEHCSCRTNAGTLSASPTHQVLGMASLEHICRYFLHTLVCLSDCCKSPLILISPRCCIIGCHRGSGLAASRCMQQEAAAHSVVFVAQLFATNCVQRKRFCVLHQC